MLASDRQVREAFLLTFMPRRGRSNTMALFLIIHPFLYNLKNKRFKKLFRRLFVGKAKKRFVNIIEEIKILIN